MNRITAATMVITIQSIWPDRPWSQTRVEQWTDVLEGLDERLADTALVRFRNNSDKCPSIAEFLTIAKPAHDRRSDRHSVQCMCAGFGWLEVEQHNDLGTWKAWARCPHGPPTVFHEPDEEYDPVAGAAAHETFNALVATAETRADLANACFAAAAAYANAERKTLL